LVHPKNFLKPKRPAVYARGYPLGTEYQMVTNGVVSGLKHTRSQCYIVTTATINGGNSGGPCVNEQGDVIDINSMKLVAKGVEEINMIIPSNRVMRTLPLLTNNSENESEIRKIIAKLMLKKIMEKARAKALSPQDVKKVGENLQGLEDLDYKIVVSNWNQHSVGGFKRGKDGVVTPVSISDWYVKHVHQKEGGHALFQHVYKHLHDNEIEEVIQLRKTGFQNFKCECHSEQMACGKKHPKNMMDNVIVPPRLVSIPRLGFQFSNSTGKKTLDFYKAPQEVKEGVIISSMSSCGLFVSCGFSVGDYLYSVGGRSVSNYGEVWDVSSNVGRKLVDVLSSLEFGGSVGCGVLRLNGGVCEKHVVNFCYKEGGQGELRAPLGFLDASVLRSEVYDVEGVRLKPLRLSDVIQFNLRNYMGDEHAHKFRVVISNLDTHSDAYHSKTVRPGDVISKINNQPVPNTWVEVTQVLDAHPKEQPLHLSTESGKIIII